MKLKKWVDTLSFMFWSLKCSKDGSHIIHNFVLIYFPLLKILCKYLRTFKTAGFMLILTIRSHFYHMFFHSRKYCFISIHGKKSHFACNNRKIFESINRFKANFQKTCKIKKSSQPCVFYVKNSYFLVFCAIKIKHILSIYL